MGILWGLTKQSEKKLNRSEIEAVLTAIQQNHELFNAAQDEALIDSVIYEHNALMAQYRYLLNKARGK